MTAPTRPMPHDNDRSADIGALAWVHDELRRSLDAANKAVRRFVKETEAAGGGSGGDLDAVDPAVLRGARAQLHQGVGALELVGQHAAATLLRASEALLQRHVAKPHKLAAPAVDAIERASFALLDYLGRLLAGKPAAALSLFPQYRAVQEAAGADRVHPADLWDVDWQWREVPGDASADTATDAASTALAPDAATLAALEAQLLPLMRAAHPEPAAARMSELCAGLGAGAAQPQVATLWRLAAAVFEAQAQGLLGFDVFSKRVASRLLAQFRMLARGESDVSERLAHDLLFFCAQSAPPGDARAAPRLTAVRNAYGLAQYVPADYTASVLGRFDPALIAQARKRVAAAKDGWSGVAGGELHRMSGLAEQFALVGESLKRLFPHGDAVAGELQHAVAQTQQGGSPPPAALAMEVATGLLYIEAALEDGDLDRPAQAARMQRLAQRLAAVRAGHAGDALEPWMEELYRRVADRQTMGSVVQELRASLAEAEGAIDEYFRRPAQPQVLIPVPKQLAAMRGVLSVLGMDHASVALLHMRDVVDALAAAGLDAPAPAAQGGVFEQLAGNLGALGFLIDMLGVQPQMAKALFEYDADAGILRPVLGRGAAPAVPGVAAAPGAPSAPTAPAEPRPGEQRLIEQAQLLAFASVREDVAAADVSRDLERLSHEAQAAYQPQLAAAALRARDALAQADGAAAQAVVRGELSEALVDFVATASDPAGIDRETGTPAPLTLDFPASTASAALAQDDEMRAVFLDEAREVLADAAAARAELAGASDDLGLLTRLRRAFHTLKGSARMVGLNEFGEAAWAAEQLYNTQLAQQAAAPAALLEFTQWCLGELGDWIDAIGAHRATQHTAARVAQAAARVADASVAAPAEAAPIGFELDFGGGEVGAAAPAAPQPEPEPAASSAPALPEVEALPAAADAAAQPIDLELEFDTASEPEPEPAEAPASVHGDFDDEQVKLVGPLRIGIPLFNIYLNEADELSRRLGTELAEWAMELHRPIGETPIALAHSLAGSSATVGFADLSQLARALEHAQTRSLAIGRGTPDEAQLFVDAADEIRRLLHQFAAGFLKQPSAELLARLAEHELSSARRLDAAAAAAEHPAVSEAGALIQPSPEPDDELVVAALHAAPPAVHDSIFGRHDTSFGALGLGELKALGELPTEPPRAAASRHALADASDDADDTIDAVDAIDAELFPFFAEEAAELLPQLASRLRDWARQPDAAAAPAACMRTLHTLKGGARLAGAMRLGEMAHRLETRIERLLARPEVDGAEVEPLQTHADALMQTFDALRAAATPQAAPLVIDTLPEAAAPVIETPPVPGTAAPEPEAARDAAPAESALPAAPEPEPEPERVVEPAAMAAALPEIDWARFTHATAAQPTPQRAQHAAQSSVRVRAPLLDRLVNQAGEVSITRSRIESGVAQIKTSLADLTDNLERLRAQLRDIEFHGEVQMTSRLEAAKAAAQSFDPLEFDRFTRFQELTRMMAESVNDVATVQRSLQRSLEVTEDELVAQARMTRELQDDLLRTRMVEFEGLSDRLYRVVRQAAKETGKSVRLDIVGGSIEVDRGVLDRMTGAFEHLLRNCVGHGIEMPEVRTRAGKDATGSIIVALSHEGNEVGVEFRDDGAGLDLPRIRAKGVALGLLDANAPASDAELAALIFTPGFSTADSVTELAGRGIGMDVVRSEVNAIGGRVEIATAAGQGTSFKLILPLTTAVTQVVMLRCGETHVAVPSTLVEVVRRVTPGEVDAAYASGGFAVGDRPLPFFWLGSLLQVSARPGADAGRARAVVVIRSAQQRIALHVDEVMGNHEVVVKHLGPQLSRLPGLAGITLLASGTVALIYNPVALAALYGEAARAATDAALRAPAASAAAVLVPSEPEAPLVMVVDDSLTVRRVTQRLLQREGYRVVLAKDGLDALERLAEGVPAIVLSDIEMPRMDGFDLVRNMRADARLRELPVIMITSRIAQKHRDHAVQLGVDHYLGKPYSEEDLLALIARYTRSRAVAA